MEAGVITVLFYSMLLIIFRLLLILIMIQPPNSSTVSRKINCNYKTDIIAFIQRSNVCA